VTITEQALDLAAAVTVDPEAMESPGLPVPDDPAAIAVFTAHRIDEIMHKLSHASQRMEAARSASGDLRKYHAARLAGHLKAALDAGHDLKANIDAHYPAEAAELEALKQTLGLAAAVSGAAKEATTAHLVASTLNELTHADRHAQAMTEDTPDDEFEFNADHAEKHLAGAVEHAGKLSVHFRDNYPAEAKWLAGLDEITASAVGDGGEKQHARYSKDGGGTITAQMAAPETIGGQAIDLVGPKGYIHGWIFVGIPGPGAEVFHPGHGRGTVTSSEGGRVRVSFDSGHAASFPVRSHQGPGHFEQMTDDELAAEYNRSEGSHASAVVGELDRRDQRDEDQAAQAKAQRVSALYAEKPKTEADRSRVYQGLVNEGENPEDAWAHAHGTNPEAMQKQAVVADLRAQGHKGSGFDALTRDAFKDEIRRRTISAEGATNGYMLGPAGKKAGIDPWSLFTGPESRARKYASPELKEWFDQNGRPTVADFQASLMGQKAAAGRRDFYASVTWDDLADAVIELAAEQGGGTVSAQLANADTITGQMR
jgi:hypothetical protein